MSKSLSIIDCPITVTKTTIEFDVSIDGSETIIIFNKANVLRAIKAFDDNPRAIRLMDITLPNRRAGK